MHGFWRDSHFRRIRGWRIRGLLLMLLFAILLSFFLVLLPKGHPVLDSIFHIDSVMVEYHFQRLGMHIRFPSTFRVHEAPYNGGEIRYTILAEGGQGVRMMVQGWKMKDLQGFIETSLINAPSIDAVSYLPYSAAGYTGYLISYRQHLGEKRMAFITEVFLQTKKDEVTRFSLIMGEKAAGEAWERLFFQVVSSYRQEL